MYGYINIIRLDDIQDRPKLFSTFMLSLLAELYETLAEEGDLDTQNWFFLLMKPI